MDSLNTFFRFMQEGGIFMYPILIVLALGIAIAIERYFFLTSSASACRKTWDQLLPYLNKGNYAKAIEATSKSNTPMGKILNYGLARMGTTRRRTDIETAMDEGLMEITSRLEKRTHYLATFANISTLLGLLGTVSGLIDAFAAVSQADPAQKAELLSASISEAMNCTAFGLGAAIPMMLLYSFLQSKTTEMVDSLEMVAVKFLNLLQEPTPPSQPVKEGAKA